MATGVNAHDIFVYDLSFGREGTEAETETAILDLSGDAINSQLIGTSVRRKLYLLSSLTLTTF